MKIGGGKVLVPLTMIRPQLGFIARFRDSECNRIALHASTVSTS